MADLPLLQSGRVENIGISGAVTPQVNVPQVDYVGLRAGAQANNQIATTLDRLSSNLFGIASEAAKQAGMQYVADNPITDEQLRAAKEGNTDAMGVGPRGSMNIFDQAVRKARAFEVSASFEAEARNELATMLSSIEQGQTTTEQAQQKIATMMTGYSKSLAQVDPEASLKFRATIATAGNTVLAKAAEAELKRAKQEKLIKFDMDFDSSVRLLEAAVSQGFWVDPRSGQKRSVDDLADVYRQTISTSALLLGDAQTQKAYSDKFEAALKSAKIGAVSAHVTAPEFSADPDAALQLLRTGQLGKMTDVFMSMPFEDKSKVVANFMVTVNQREAAAKNKQDAADKAALGQFIPLYNQAIALPEGSAQRRTLVRQIATLAEANPKVVPISVLSDLQKPSTEGNPMAEFNALSAIYSGRITSPDQIYALPGLNGKQKVNLLGKLVSEDRREQSELDRGISRLAGIPVVPGQVVVLDPKAKEWERRQRLVADADAIRSKAMAEGKVISNRDILQQLETNLEQRRNNETAKQARDALKTYETKYGGAITRDSLPALEKKLGTGKAAQNDLTRIRRLLDQADGDN
jgi:hypothetical protein